MLTYQESARLNDRTYSLKDSQKGNAVGNHRPIALFACLNFYVGRKMSTYANLPKEARGTKRSQRKIQMGKKDQLITDKTVLKNYKRGKINVALVWVDLYGAT